MFILFVLVALWQFSLTSSQTCSLEDNTDYDNGFLLFLYQIPTAQDCCAACATFEECTTYSYIKAQSAGEYYQRCYIKSSTTGKKINNATTAGNINRPPPPAPQCGGQEDDTDFNNGWLSLLQHVPSAAVCCDECGNYPGCVAWSWIKDPTAGDWYQRCFFHGSTANKVANKGTVAGTPISRTPAPPRSGKRGLAWFNSKSCSDLKLMSKVSFIYNWGTGPDEELMNCFESLGIEYIPMQWGGGGIDTLNQTIFAGSKHFFGFNEPNFKSQSNVLPAEAAKLWKTIEQIGDQKGLKLGSPSAAACGPNPETECYAGSWDPTQWFVDFFGNCSGCRVDFLTTHIYTCDINQFTTFLNNLKRFNKPIWLTEFACPAAHQPIDFEINFLKQALAYLDNEPMIERYAWFGTRLDPNDGWLGPQVDLLDSSKCALTQVGQLYNS